MYKAIEYFTDLQDNGYAYKVGDTYPRMGYIPPQERIDELAGAKNMRGRAVIEKVYENTPDESPEEEKNEEEKPKKRSRKKADE